LAYLWGVHPIQAYSTRRGHQRITVNDPINGEGIAVFTAELGATVPAKNIIEVNEGISNLVANDDKDGDDDHIAYDSSGTLDHEQIALVG
jgi:hypothetical protein